jgi:sulfur carrier protein ThiS
MQAHTMDIHCGSSTTVADALRMLEVEQVEYVAVVEAGRVTAVVRRKQLLEASRRPDLGPGEPLGRFVTGRRAAVLPERSP